MRGPPFALTVAGVGRPKPPEIGATVKADVPSGSKRSMAVCVEGFANGYSK